MRVKVTFNFIIIFFFLFTKENNTLFGESKKRRIYPESSPSLSIGSVAKGKLINGVRLPNVGQGFINEIEYKPNREANWGTEELIKGLIDGAEKVKKLYPGSILYIRDLSLKDGGPIPHHGSHQSGRDADLLFYLVNEEKEIVPSKLIKLNKNGIGEEIDKDGRKRFYYFDAKRTWSLIKFMILNKDMHLQRIFISEDLRRLILNEAYKEKNLPKWVLERGEQILCEPNTPHDDHIHLRIFCTIEDYHYGCRDSWPLYPWRVRELAKYGITRPQLATPTPRIIKRLKMILRERPPRRRWCP